MRIQRKDYQNTDLQSSYRSIQKGLATFAVLNNIIAKLSWDT